MTFFFKSSLEDILFHWFLERVKGREKEQGGEKHQCERDTWTGCLPNGAPSTGEGRVNPQSRYMPLMGNLTPQSVSWCSDHWANLARADNDHPILSALDLDHLRFQTRLVLHSPQSCFGSISYSCCVILKRALLKSPPSPASFSLPCPGDWAFVMENTRHIFFIDF